MNWNPWKTIRELRAQVDALTEAIANPELTGIEIERGALQIGMQGVGPKLVAGMFLGMFEHPEAKNYVEVRLSSSEGEILVTAIRPGGKTPNQLRREAEMELAALKAKVAA